MSKAKMKPDSGAIKNLQPGADRIECHGANMRAARVLAPPFNTLGCRTFFELEEHLRSAVTKVLVQFSATEKPLEKSLSSWVWLRPDGTVLVEETDIREGTRHYVDEHRDHVVAVFASHEYATPDSRFHIRRPDIGGPYAGSIAKRWCGCPPFWRTFTNKMPAYGISLHPRFGARIVYRRFRLEPMGHIARTKIINSGDFQRCLKHGLQAWLSSGVLILLLNQQGFPSLHAAMKEQDKLLITVAGGPAIFEKLLVEKAEAHLQAALRKARRVATD